MKSILCFLTIVPFLLSGNGIEDAKIYHANSALQWHIAMDTISLITLLDSDHILDIGCGDGKITAYLAKNTPNGSVLGIDISKAMIDFATAHYPKTVYSNLTFTQEDAAEIAFENQFDKILSFSTLHWVMDQEKALKAIYRALVPGGKICLQTYGKGNMHVTELADRLVQTAKWKPYFPAYSMQRVFFSEQEYQALCEKAGFMDIKINGAWTITPFANQQALSDFVTPLLNFIKHLVEEMQQEFIKELVDQIVAIATKGQDGTIYYQTYNLSVTATK